MSLIFLELQAFRLNVVFPLQFGFKCKYTYMAFHILAFITIVCLSNNLLMEPHWKSKSQVTMFIMIHKIGGWLLSKYSSMTFNILAFFFIYVDLHHNLIPKPFQEHLCTNIQQQKRCAVSADLCYGVQLLLFSASCAR